MANGGGTPATPSSGGKILRRVVTLAPEFPRGVKLQAPTVITGLTVPLLLEACLSLSRCSSTSISYFGVCFWGNRNKDKICPVKQLSGVACTDTTVSSSRCTQLPVSCLLPRY